MTYEPTEDEIQVLPCGCVITTIVATKTIQIAPCRLECQTLKDALEIARDRGRPVKYVEGP